MKSFSEYMLEDSLAVNLSAKPASKKNLHLGFVDSTDYQTISRIKASIIANATETHFKALLEQNGYSQNIYDDISGTVTKYITEPEHNQLFVDVLNGKNIYKVDISKPLNTDSIENLAGYYNSKYKVPKNLFIELSNITSKDSTGTIIGKGEIVLGLFSNLRNASGAGDLATSNGTPIEVKGPSGRLRGQAMTKKFDDVASELLDIVRSPSSLWQKNNDPRINNLLQAFSGRKSLSDINFAVFDEFIQDHRTNSTVLSRIIKALFPYSTNYKPSKTDQRNLVNAVTNKGNDLKAFLLSIHIHAYGQVEDFEYLMLFKKGYINFATINLSKATSIDDIYQLLKNFKLSIAAWANGMRDNAFGITIK